MREKIIAAETRFGRLVVIKKTNKIDRSGNIFYLCRCDCGVIKEFRNCNLKSGKTNSCGCLGKRLGTEETYNTWYRMRQRCYNIYDESYNNYGKRGIKVCDRWSLYKNFYEDMGNVPTNYTLERINTNGNYFPENCRWATRKEQANNRRNNHLLTIDNRTMTMAQWCELLGINQNAFKGRIINGWSFVEAATKPLQRRGGF